MEVIVIGNLFKAEAWDDPQRGRIYATNGIAPCVNGCGGGAIPAKILVKVKRGKQADISG